MSVNGVRWGCGWHRLCSRWLTGRRRHNVVVDAEDAFVRSCNLFCRRVQRSLIICCCKTSMLACCWRIHSTNCPADVGMVPSECGVESFTVVVCYHVFVVYIPQRDAHRWAKAGWSMRTGVVDSQSRISLTFQGVTAVLFQFSDSFLRATAYMLSAHMLSQFRPSVRLSVCHTVTRVDQSKTVEVRIM